MGKRLDRFLNFCASKGWQNFCRFLMYFFGANPASCQLKKVKFEHMQFPRESSSPSPQQSEAQIIVDAPKKEPDPSLGSQDLLSPPPIYVQNALDTAIFYGKINVVKVLTTKYLNSFSDEQLANACILAAMRSREISANGSSPQKEIAVDVIDAFSSRVELRIETEKISMEAADFLKKHITELEDMQPCTDGRLGELYGLAVRSGLPPISESEAKRYQPYCDLLRTYNVIDKSIERRSDRFKKFSPGSQSNPQTGPTPSHS